MHTGTQDLRAKPGNNIILHSNRKEVIIIYYYVKMVNILLYSHEFPEYIIFTEKEGVEYFMQNVLPMIQSPDHYEYRKTGECEVINGRIYPIDDEEE